MLASYFDRADAAVQLRQHGGVVAFPCALFRLRQPVKAGFSQVCALRHARFLLQDSQGMLDPLRNCEQHERCPMFTNISRAMTGASLALIIAIGGSAVLLSGAANAAPLALGKSAITQADDSDVTLVRDGCGRGMRYSHRRGGCVPSDGPRGDDPGRVIGGIINRAIDPGPRRGDGCGRGWRYSNSRGRCVPN
jgi:hypothetical protein